MGQETERWTTVRSDPTFEPWLEQEFDYAATAMSTSISAIDLVKQRPGFGQTVRPVAGSIIASPVLGAYDPDPDYFFHWFRDSAVVIEALRLLADRGRAGPQALEHFRDFVHFSLGLQKLDGRAVTARPDRRANVAADFLRFLRDDAELASVHPGNVVAETRVNPDGTLDISKWARPQHDGPPLRALALLRWARGRSFEPGLQADVAALIGADLEFTLSHWRDPSFDIWEEESGRHYYTLRVSAAALDEGAAWLEQSGGGDSSRPRQYREQADIILQTLDGFWLADEGHYRSRILADGMRSTKELDIAVILAAIHAQGTGPTHSVRDPRMHATLVRLESLFGAAYPINQNRPRNTGPAMGRYAGDVYYSGGAYYFSTLGAAEFCFHAAAHARDARNWFERGDAYLAMVRAYTPVGGELSEQFDQRTGRQTSARHLAWSYAAFISCIAARQEVAAGPA